jgi:hypothetical protein
VTENQSGICKYCETDSVNQDGILCQDCADGNRVNLLINCKKCGSNSNLYRQTHDCIGVLGHQIYTGNAGMEDVKWTGTGFIVFTNSCPECWDNKCKGCKNCKCEK